MLLAFDTSSAACTAALFDEAGACVARADELIGRGHAERLVPMIAELLDGRRGRPNSRRRGPGQLHRDPRRDRRLARARDRLGRRAVRHVLAGAARGGPLRLRAEVAAAVIGGHGELFVQQFDAATLQPVSELRSAIPSEAARLTRAELVVGSGAQALVDARGSGEARELWPSAANALRLPEALRTLPPKPVYARAPDARAREAA